MKTTDLQVKGSLAETSHNRAVEFAEAFLTVDAIMICDVSGSMAERDVPCEGGVRSRFDECNEQLKRLQRRFPGRLAVVAFSSDVAFVPGGVLPFMGGGTELTEALEFVRPADGTGIKYIVASDGCPSDPEGCLRVAKSMSPIDAIYIGTDPEGKEFMEKLAKASGGKSVDVGVELLEDVVVKLLGDGK